MKDTHETLEAKRLFRVYTSDTGCIACLYGPAKATCRAHILSVLTGRKVTTSKAGWNVFRNAMLSLYGINGPCSADEDSLLQNAARSPHVC